MTALEVKCCHVSHEYISNRVQQEEGLRDEP